MSIHVRGPGARGDEVAAAVALAIADLHAADAMFSPYRDDSAVCRMQRGELALADADPLVREVHRLCETALERTGGWFDAWNAVPGRPGVFDPTGLTKTWAVARAGRHLRALATGRGPAAGLGFAIGAGGDVLTVPGADGAPWLVGVEDPRDRSRVVATLEAHDGGVATSGTAARGGHILDPRTGAEAVTVLSVTVAGPSLLWADVLATAAVARGPACVAWLREQRGTSGLVVLADGDTVPWAAPL